MLLIDHPPRTENKHRISRNYSMQMTEGTLNVFRFSSIYILFTHHDGEEMSDVTLIW